MRVFDRLCLSVPVLALSLHQLLCCAVSCCVMLCHGVQDDAILVADNDTVLCSTDSAFQPLYVEFFASNVAAA